MISRSERPGHPARRGPWCSSDARRPAHRRLRRSPDGGAHGPGDRDLIDSGKVSPHQPEGGAPAPRCCASEATDVEQLRAMLPGSVAEHAEDLAWLLTTDVRRGPPTRRHPNPDATAGRPPPPETRVGRGLRRRRRTHQHVPARHPHRRHRFRVAENPRSAQRTSPSSATGEQQRPEPSPSPAAPTATRRGDPGALTLSWPPYLPGAGTTEAVVLYRLVSSDDSAP